MSKKKIICFDFDGTMANSQPLEKASMVKTINDFGCDTVTEENIEDYYGPSEPGIIRNFVSEDEFPAALSYFYRIYSELEPTLLSKVDGIDTLLEELSKKENLTLVLVTGRSKETSEISLATLGYDTYFKGIYAGSMDGINKGESMDKVLDELGCEKEEMIYIGDTVEDINTMHEYGYDLISVAYCHDDEYRKRLEELNPGNVVGSIDELKAKIESII